MAFQWTLAGFGPAGIAAAVAITIGMAALSGVFVTEETVNEDDYNDDGIYVPPVVLPNPNQNENPVINPNPGENDNPDEDGPAYPDVNVDPNKGQTSLVFPWGFVCVSPHVTPTDDYDPDIPEDIRPPSSDFVVAAEPYDSGAGWIIAALMGFIATFSVTVTMMTSLGGAGTADDGHGRGIVRGTRNDRRRYP